MNTDLKVGMTVVVYQSYDNKIWGKIYGTITSMSYSGKFFLVKYLVNGMERRTITTSKYIKTLSKEEQLEYTFLKLAGKSSIVKV